MVNRPKQIGTRAETAVTRYARTHGHPHAERLALHGATDLGDIRLHPGLIAEVKAGHTAETASPTQIQTWWHQTITERHNHGATAALLITKRAGYSPNRCGYWDTHMDLTTLLTLLDAPAPQDTTPLTPLIRMSLDSALTLTTHWAALQPTSH